MAFKTLKLKVGDPIVWCVNDLVDPKIRSGTITKISPRETWCWVDGHHKAEDCVAYEYVFPASAKDELIKILEERRALKKAYDDSIGLIYKLRNRVALGEFDG